MGEQWYCKPQVRGSIPRVSTSRLAQPLGASLRQSSLFKALDAVGVRAICRRGRLRALGRPKTAAKVALRQPLRHGLRSGAQLAGVARHDSSCL